MMPTVVTRIRCYVMLYSAWPGPVDVKDQGEVLSFKPGAAVRHSRFLLTETLPRVFLSACLTALSQARRAREEVAVQYGCDEGV
ncbi:hypothetical protein GBF38_009690 [Nibea albiflora]|uniref:Uncharacterized protein n=1 Tax=Nibea albiflora TaxID=240163 RepID=A0ACB7F8E9_NIBAL|nr:hypothetical protein GBF38_009690 [Nibea albiflora]